MLNLITDRTQNDVKYVTTIRNKIIDGSITSSELVEWNNGLKGSYNYTDLNRVGNAVSTIVAELNDVGYIIMLNPKTDWALGDIPTPAQMTTYLSNIVAIKSILDLDKALPSSMNKISYEDANHIEELLLEAEQIIIGKYADLYFCDTEAYTGDTIGVI